MFDLDNKTWLMEPTAAAALHRRMAMTTDWPSPDRMAAFREAAASKALRKATGGVAVMFVQGVIEPRLSPLSMLYGDGFSIEDGSEILDKLVSARDIGTIAMVYDTPGGLTDQVEEFGDQIFEARKIKPIHSMANTMMASAGYWLGSQANSLTVAPSSKVGSIGVYTQHVSLQRKLEAEGVEVTTISSEGSPYKTELEQFQALTPAARDYLQSFVDDELDNFVAAIARGMNVQASTVRSKFGKGRLLTPKQAVEAGAAHRILSYRQFIDRLHNGRQVEESGSKALTDVGVLRLRHEHRKRVTVF